MQGASNARKNAASVSAARGGASALGSIAGGLGSALASIGSRIAGNRVALVTAIVIAVLLIGGIWDSAANMGKALGNVSVNGQSVAGMDEEQIRTLLRDSYGSRVDATEVTINAADESGIANLSDKMEEDDERDLLAESVAAEYGDNTTSWVATAESLHAGLPYDQVVEQALAQGRGGGPFSRLALMVSGADIPLTVQFDEASVEALASNVDKSVGEVRVDATAIVENNEARVLPGHDGRMVDRDWLDEQLVDAFMSDESQVSFDAQVIDAPSRTTAEQAQETCDAINKALNASASFDYQGQSWTATGADFSKWTKVVVVEDGDEYALKIVIDKSVATPDLVKGLGATVSADDVTVSFGVDDANITVYTSRSGTIPELSQALQQLEDYLYGEGGFAYDSSAQPTCQIAVSESDAPESVTFDEALGLGLITVIGEYSTDFSNDEGTENRNHNIRLVSDLLNNTVCTADGGKWSFNEHSGDTNLDPPFASAGSIVNGEYVDSIGGGICQVATTIFNSVYEAGLDIDERWNHSLYLANYPDGRDASVSYPDLDLVWSNPLKSDVLLKVDYTDTSVTARLYSTYTGYHVETKVGEWEEGEKYTTEFETDDSLVEGQFYQKTFGEDGSRISVTRTVYDKDDKVIGENEFASNYTPKNEVYVIGPGTDTSNLARRADGESRSDEDDQLLDEGSESSTDPYSEDAYAGYGSDYDDYASDSYGLDYADYGGEEDF